MRRREAPAAVCVLLALTIPPATAPAAEPEPVRIHYFGNSLTDVLRYDAFQKLAGQAGHPVAWKREMAPGVPVCWHWQQRPRWEKKLTEQRWDVVTLQPFQNFEVEYRACERFARFLEEHQPDCQLYIYAQWQGRKSGHWLADFLATEPVVPADPDRGWAATCRKKTGPKFHLENVAADVKKAGMPALVERSLKTQYELTVRGLRARVGMKKPVKLIPAGHVLELLDSKMRAGLVPGYRSPYGLYTDGIHFNNVGSYVVACTFYATIFGAGPVGLPVGEYAPDPRHHSMHYPLPDELARVIQETVWQVVATHPLTGVTADETVEVATASLDPAVAGEPYRFQLYHAFGKAPHVWTVADGDLPAGLELDAGGLLHGTPTGGAGKRQIGFAVKDAAGTVARRELALTVEPDTAPQIVTASELPGRRLGEFFRLKLRARGGNGAMQWSTAKRRGFLPPGLMLHPDGTLTGSPGRQGRHEFELKVTDADRGRAESDTRTFAIEVAPPGEGVFRARYIDPKKHKVEADGVLDEPFWKLDTPIEKRVVGERTDVKATFDIVHRGGDFYVAVKVIDPDRHTKRDDLPDGDSVEVFVDVLNNREAVYNFDDRRVVVAPIKGHYRPLVIAPMTFGHRGKVVQTEDGYTAEFWFSAWALGMRNRNFPTVIGLDIAVNDDDDGDGRDSQVVWQGTAENATRPNAYGTVILEAAE